MDDSGARRAADRTNINGLSISDGLQLLAELKEVRGRRAAATLRSSLSHLGCVMRL